MKNKNSSLPIKQSLQTEIVLSWILAGLMTTLSIIGLTFQSQIYPSNELVKSFVANDAVNLLVGLPVLAFALILTIRRQLLGLLFWPGALFYVFYTYLVYLFAMPFNLNYLFYIVILSLSVWLSFRVINTMDGEYIQHNLRGMVKTRPGAGALIILGFGFAIRALIQIGSGLNNKVALTGSEMALNTSDLILSLAWIICGLALWRQTPLGFLTGGGLLYQGSMLFVGVIVVILIHPSSMQNQLTS
ncbi:MAG: hypothetical protein JEZ06_01785 [Anaerolineaceae bacterium]|nr:hypothetical protein [Anaerolineaceae bacterium]